MSEKTTFLVGCRVNGEIQHYSIDALDYEDAQAIVKEDVEGANPVLVVIK